MFTFTDIALTDFSNNNIHYKKLHELFKATLNPDLSEKEFYFYYRYDKPERVRITFINYNNETVGFISVSEYKKKLLNKEHIICRVAVGLLPEYRKGNFPVGKLCSRIMWYKLSHPFCTMYLTGYLANPLMYGMICKYTHQVYPKYNQRVNDKISALRLAVLKNAGMIKKEIMPFVLKIHFKVCLGYEDKMRIQSSSDKNVLYYLEKNPGYTEQNGLMVILPVSWLNIAATLYKACMKRPALKYLLALRQQSSLIFSSKYLQQPRIGFEKQR